MADQSMHFAASKPTTTQIVLKQTFSSSREKVFAALTEAKQLLQWMKPVNMTFQACGIDLRPGGALRYRFQSPSGRNIEVRGTFELVEPPARFSYRESYDFSPLTVQVTTALEEAAHSTTLVQTLDYPSQAERD